MQAAGQACPPAPTSALPAADKGAGDGGTSLMRRHSMRRHTSLALAKRSPQMAAVHEPGGRAHAAPYARHAVTRGDMLAARQDRVAQRRRRPCSRAPGEAHHRLWPTARVAPPPADRRGGVDRRVNGSAALPSEPPVAVVSARYSVKAGLQSPPELPMGVPGPRASFPPRDLVSGVATCLRPDLQEWRSQWPGCASLEVVPPL